MSAWYQPWLCPSRPPASGLRPCIPGCAVCTWLFCRMLSSWSFKYLSVGGRILAFSTVHYSRGRSVSSTTANLASPLQLSGLAFPLPGTTFPSSLACFSQLYNVASLMPSAWAISGIGRLCGAIACSAQWLCVR